MTDEKYLFEQTSRERKRNARGSFAKKGESRSKRCSLPSDYLTTKERKELNGAVYEINLNKPMYWTEFLAMPKDLQKEYLRKLIVELKGRRTDIVMMFNVPQSTFGKWMRENYESSPFDSKSCPRHMSKEFADFWAIRTAEETIRQEPIEDENVAPGPSDAVKHDDSAPTTLKPIRLDVVSGSINYIGDPYAVFEKALLAIDPSKEYHFQIRFKEVVE